MSEITKTQLKEAFEKMLSRVGGGFRFTAWFSDVPEEKSERGSALAVQTGSDFAIGLYGSDFEKRSHIACYSTSFTGAKGQAIHTVIAYYEGIAKDPLPWIGTAGEKIVKSDSLILQQTSRNNKGISSSRRRMLEMIDGFSKSIGAF